MTSPHLSFLPTFITAPDAVALCAEVDPDSWFPEQGGPQQWVKDLCRRCELESDCLDWALTHDEFGVWGATSEHERRELKKGRVQVRHTSRTWTDETTHQYVRDLTSRGWTATEIAWDLGISERTVQRIRAAANPPAPFAPPTPRRTA